MPENYTLFWYRCLTDTVAIGEIDHITYSNIGAALDHYAELANKADTHVIFVEGFVITESKRS